MSRRESVRKAADGFRPSASDAPRPSLEPALAGFLEKRGHRAPFRWQKRYFLAIGHYLRYYKDDEPLRYY